MRSPVPAGIPLHVEERGSGPPLLLLHGFGASSFTFRRWVDELARRRRVLLVDMKGFGQAPKPDDQRYSPLDLAEPVIRLVRETGLTDLTLLGHSLGGGVALLVALDLLDRGELGRLQGLVSVSGVAYRQPLPTYVGMARRPWTGMVALRLLPARWVVRAVLRSIVHDPSSVTREQIAGYADPFSERAARLALLDSARQILPPDVDAIAERYPELDLPVLLVWGEGDRVVPPWVGERLARDLPDARLVLLDRCGHVPPEEAPERSLAPILAFLREVDDGTEGAP
jgi:pimeloyl-ACP methyl ester carboxylesterase